MASPISIRVFASHPVASAQYKRLLSAQPDLHIVASDEPFEVGIFDGEFTNVAGVMAVVRLKLPSMRPLLVSGSADEERCVRWVMQGVWGLVTYDCCDQDLPHAVRQLAAGQLWFPPRVIKQWMQVTAARHAADAALPLTDRERDVLDLLVRDRSNKEIAETLRISESTTKFHVANILTKLQLHSRREIVFATSQAASALGDVPDTRCPIYPERTCPFALAARRGSAN